MHTIKMVLAKTINFISSLLMIIITIVVLLQIVFRFSGAQATWTMEIVRFLFVFLVFIGSTLAIEKKEHIAIKGVVESLPLKYQNVLEVLVHLLIIAFLIIFIWGNLSLMNSTRGTTLTSMSWFKMEYLYITMIASASLMIFYSIIEAFEISFKTINIRRLKK